MVARGRELNVLESSEHEWSGVPRLTSSSSLSPGKAHDTPYVGAVVGEKPCQLGGMQGQQLKQQQERKKATKVAAVERISRVPKQP
eukprot:1139466-Pelagomonas_calceolata.AAC.3